MTVNWRHFSFSIGSKISKHEIWVDTKQFMRTILESPSVCLSLNRLECWNTTASLRQEEQEQTVQLLDVLDRHR